MELPAGPGGSSWLTPASDWDEVVGRRLAGGGGFSIFEMGTHIWVFLVNGMMLAIIILTIVLEKLMHSMQHSLPESYQPVVHKVQSELMVMGFISFILVLIVANNDLHLDTFLSIEFAHLLLFLSGLWSALYGLFTLISMRSIKRGWDKLEQTSALTIVGALEEDQSHWSSAVSLVKSSNARRMAEYHCMREAFFDHYDLKPPPKSGNSRRRSTVTEGFGAGAFDFSLYLRKSLNVHVKQFMEVEILGWAGIMTCNVIFMLASMQQADGISSSSSGGSSSGSSSSVDSSSSASSSSSSSSSSSNSSGSSSGAYGCGSPDPPWCDGMPQWSCAYCEDDQARVKDAHIWMACYLGLGWSLLIVRIVLSRYILWARNNFLRQHCATGGPDGLKEAVRKHVDAKEPAGIKESSFQQAVRSTTHARMGVHTIPKKKAHELGMPSGTDGGEGGGPGGGEEGGHGAGQLARGKSAEHLQEALNRGEATKLSKDVFPCGGTKVFRQVSSCVRVIEGYYFSMIVLNGWGMASLVFGPWEGVLLAVLMMLPLVLAVLVSTSTLDEYAFLLAVCQPNMEVLVKVEHASISMMHAYVELREQFARMFAVVNPGLASTGLSAVCVRAFSDADADGSGQISHREFRLMVQRLTGSTMSLTNLKRVIRVIDTDQSGSINLKEFMLFVGVNEVADASPYVRAVQVSQREWTHWKRWDRTRMAHEAVAPLAPLVWRSRDVDGHGHPCEPDAHACSALYCACSQPFRPLALSDPPSHPLQALNMANRLQSTDNDDASSAQDPDASEASPPARAVSDASTAPRAAAPASTGGAPSAVVVPSLALGSREEPGSGGGHMIKPRHPVGNQQKNTTKQMDTEFDDDPMAC